MKTAGASAGRLGGKGGAGRHGVRGASGDVLARGPGFPPSSLPPARAPSPPVSNPPETLNWLGDSSGPVTRCGRGHPRGRCGAGRGFQRIQEPVNPSRPPHPPSAGRKDRRGASEVTPPVGDDAEIFLKIYSPALCCTCRSGMASERQLAGGSGLEKDSNTVLNTPREGRGRGNSRISRRRPRSGVVCGVSVCSSKSQVSVVLSQGLPTPPPPPSRPRPPAPPLPGEAAGRQTPLPPPLGGRDRMRPTAPPP